MIESLVQLNEGTFVALTLKSGAILVGAFALTLSLRGRAPRVRYAVWTMALLGTLTLPLLAALLPAWSVPFLPQFTTTRHLDAAPPFDAFPRPAGTRSMPEIPLELESPASTVDLELALDPSLTSLEDPASPSAFPWLPLLWIAGVSISGLGLATSLGRIHHATREAYPAADASWGRVLGAVRRQLGLTRPIQLLFSPTIPTPVTWGMRHPVVILPAAAQEWTEERRHVVLLHEMIHIHRSDWLIQMLAQFTCVLYWFHPLVWWASRSLAHERELACDDEVISVGTRPSAYATHLLELARGMAGRRSGLSDPGLRGALALVTRSRLEGRLRAILDTRRPQHGVTAMPAAFVMAALSLTLATAQPASHREDLSTDPELSSGDGSDFSTSGFPASDTPGADAQSANTRPAAEDSVALSVDVDSPAEGRHAAASAGEIPALILPRFSFAEAKAMVDQGLYQDAVLALRQVTAEHPSHGPAWFYLGFSYHELGRLELALHADRIATRFPKVRPEALYNMACAYSRLGRLDNALALLRAAERSGFDQPELLERDPDLDPLRRDRSGEFQRFVDDFFPPRRHKIRG